MPEINPTRLLEDLAHLRGIGASGTGVVRPAFSSQDLEARRWLQGRMNEAGLISTIDGMGNVIGRSPHPGRAVLIGSHTDTQPQGGWLDGALGVIYGLEVFRAFTENQETAGYPVDVSSWSDEEGTYLSMLGSSSFCGKLEPRDQAAAYDIQTGTNLQDAIRDAGLEKIPPASLDRGRYMAYLEAHIEQGPYLESQMHLLGVVTAIVGLRTFKLTFIGEQNHAGSTPMNNRKDAASALIKLANILDKKIASVANPHTVWTIGHIKIEPGSHSIIPGKGEMLLQFRDQDERLLDTLETTISSQIDDFAKHSPVKVILEPVFPRQKSATMDTTLQDCLAAASELHAPAQWTRMPSGAVHDAQIFADILPTGMLFIPSIGGISHNIDENSKKEDIIRGCRALATTTELLFKEARL